MFKLSLPETALLKVYGLPSELQSPGPPEGERWIDHFLLVAANFFLHGLPFCFCFLDFIYLFLERGREGAREGEKHQVWLPLKLPTGDLAHNPGMCLDWELNQ